MGGGNFYQYAPNTSNWIDPAGLSVWQVNWEKAAGMALPNGFEVHHIIPKDQITVKAVQKICPAFDVNDAANLIALPKSQGSMPFCVELDNLKDTDAPIHQPAAMLVAAD